MGLTYTSLHNHTDFSNLKLIDAINTCEQLLTYGYELGLKGVAITDHDSVSGHVRAWNYYNSHFSPEQREQFKLILGNEIYLCRNDLTAETHQKGEKFYHMILLALDDIGYEQIREISSRAWGRSYMKNIMRTPTYSTDLYDIIGKKPGHVIATTACLGGYCGVQFAAGNYDNIEMHLQAMSELFGHDYFFIELQPSWLFDQIKYNQYMLKTYWGKYNFSLSTDSHYLKAEEREIHKVFLNSKSSGDREVDSFYASAYMMGYDEIKEYFISEKGTQATEEQFDTMCANTNHICDLVQGYNLKRISVIPRIRYDLNQTVHPFWAQIINKYPEQTKYLATVINEFHAADVALLNMLVEPWKVKVPQNKEEKYVVELDYEFEQLYEISQQLHQSMSDYFITMAKMIDIMWNEADSLVGPARGSAGSSIINYLLGITQINPLEQPVALPFWRFLHRERPGLPDIDVDSEANKRVKVFNKVQEYFQSIGGDMIHICTFGTEGSRSALDTAARGLEIDDDVVSYITAMIPNVRGFDWTLEQCYVGDAEHTPIKAFQDELNKYPKLWAVAKRIEGLVTRLGCHASGVVALNEPAWKNNAIMKTSKGIVVTAWDLEDSEQMGSVKYDYLTVQALDKIRTCMNLLLEDDVIQWQGSLRATYDKYVHPDVINYDNQDMWESLYNREIPSCFQFDTQQGSQAVALIHPHNLLELLTGNSVMRLMAEDGGELPLETYAKYKKDISLWYDEMRRAGLTTEESKLLEHYLLPVYGVAASQETMMLLSMDEHIAGFTIGEANILRKAVAKKKRDVLQKGKELFYNKGLARGTSMALLDYVWNVQVMRQAGYSFSDIHTTAYSYIALQEMNLSFFYPSIYWKCACLSVDAGAINEEDYYNLVETGIIELTDDDDKREQNKVQYGKMAKAISKFKSYIDIELPDINVARFGFTPDVERNCIMFGLRGISRLGENIINEIIINRPFTSLANFLEKMTDSEGKKLISKDRVINLIKAGAFDKLEKKSRPEILSDYIWMVADQKKRLNLMNFAMLTKQGLIPDELNFSVAVYNFTKYIRTMRYMGYYILDENGYSFYCEHYDVTKVKSIDINGIQTYVIGDKYWDAIYNKEMDKPRNYIKAHHDELLTELNRRLWQEEYDKYSKGDILRWELDSLSFYHSGHPLTHIAEQLPTEITPIPDLRENDFDGFWMIKGKAVPRYKLRTIIGAVIDKDKTKGTFTLSGVEDVIDVKLPKQVFAKFVHTLSETDEEGNKTILEDSFFEKGTFLAITGILKGAVFVPKVYKTTGFDAILKIVLDANGNFDYFLRKSD